MGKKKWYQKPWEAAKDLIPEPIREIGRQVDDAVIHPVSRAVTDAYGDVTDLANKAVNSTADLFQNASIGGWDIPGSHTVANTIRAGAPPSAEEVEQGKPLMTFANRFDQAAESLPEQVEPYAQQIVTTALTFVPGVGWILAPAFNTAMNAGRQQQAVAAGYQDEFDLGAVGKDALRNFGTALVTKGLSMGADKLMSGNQAAANSKAFADSSSGMKAGFNLQTGPDMLEAASGASQGTGAMSQGFNASQGFSSAPSLNALQGFNPELYSSTSKPVANDLSSLPSNPTSAPTQSVFNNTVKAGQNLAGEAVSSGLAPKTSSIAGVTSEAAGAGSGLGMNSSILAPGGGALDRWAPGNTVFDEANYTKAISAIANNSRQQTSDVMDQFRDNGRWALTGGSDTPYGQQETDIKNSAQAEMGQFTKEYNDYNYLSALEKANPNQYQNGRDTNYWLNEASSGYAPQQVMDAFGGYKQYAKPIPNFQSQWAPMQGAPSLMGGAL